MSFTRKAGIIGVGSAVPDRVLTNYDLEKMVDTSDEWIRTMTGIVERRIASEGEATSDFAVKAGRSAIQRAGLKPEDIDLIILATFTGDTPLPATACIVQDALGCPGTPAFDLAAGCSGFVYGLAAADAFVRSGMYEHVLVIGADLLSSVTNWTDRTTCVLFGDGAGAAVVAPVDEELGFMAFDLGSDGAAAKSLWIPAGGSRHPYTPEELA
ncbi:MAG: beta-ketoacyl-ACP synthase 3, partial [Armatimonadota bacterium]